MKIISKTVRKLYKQDNYRASISYSVNKNNKTTNRQSSWIIKNADKAKAQNQLNFRLLGLTAHSKVVEI